jgi:glycosyltransferase involved in cell wall biosynthesis
LSSLPTITILLATYNGAQHIQAQLESYRAQSYPHWELIVSDDCSRDDTVRIVEQFAGSVAQRVIMVQGPRKNFWQNFASLVRRDEAKGELFAYSDQDDIWLPEKLRQAVEWFTGGVEEGPALYFSRTELMSVDGSHLGFAPLFRRRPTFCNAIVQNIGGGNTMVFNRLAREALLATPADAELVSHDWWTYQIVTGIGGVSYYDTFPSLKYRQHGGNLIGGNRGVKARAVRLKAFANGRVKSWNMTNIKLLRSVQHLLTPENAATLDFYDRALRSAWPQRLWLLWRSGVYRQNAIETIGLYVGAVFGKL